MPRVADAFAVVLLLVTIAVTAGCQGGTPPAATPFSPAAGAVIAVANQDRGIATIVDAQRWRIVAHVDVGMDPHEGAAAPGGRVLAFASPSTWMGDARTISVVDVASSRLVRTIDLGAFRWPHGLAFVDDRILVVSSRARGGILFVDVDTGSILSSAEAPGSLPYLLHIAKPTGRIYVSSPATNTIAEYDMASRGLLRELHVPDEPVGFGVTPDGRSLWVSTGGGRTPGSLTVVDVASGDVRARLPVAGHARRFAFTAGGTRVAVTDVLAHAALIFDVAQMREVGRIPLGEGAAPSGVACAPDSNICWVATIRGGELVEIDTRELKVTRRLAIGSGADGVTYVPR